MTDPTLRRAPRFVVLSDASAPTGTEAGFPNGTRFGWRLDAANHRPLGRAARLSHSPTSCVENATLVRHRSAQLTTSISQDVDTSNWTWRLLLDGRLVVVGAHSYGRRVECLRARDQFCAAISLADPDRAVMRHFGPRALRLFGPPAGAAQAEIS